MTPAARAVLDLLAAEGPAPIYAIAERLRWPASFTGSVLTRLLRAGLAEAFPDPDTHVTTWRLTPERRARAEE